jgi:amino acid transporter
MDEQRITERTDASGTVTERIIERTPAGTSIASGRGTSLILIVLVITALAIAFFYFTGMGSSESRKDDAIAAAAGDVGDAAKDVGEAAKKAADNLTK